MDLVKQLRDKTQVGMMDCKKALEEANGDFEKALEILRKKGVAVAAKRADNVTNHGKVASEITPDYQTGALVEVACETDFSANTDAMQNFIAGVVHQVATTNPADLPTLLAQPLANNPKLTVQQSQDDLVSKICEKTQINRFVRYQVTGNGIVNTYIHPGATVGILIELATDKAPAGQLEELKQVAKDICMQVAVTNPVAVKPQDVDQAIVAKERDIAREQLKDSNKPAQVIEKIIEGKLNKFYQDACLLSQPFIKNDKTTIEQYLAEASKKVGMNITVKQFKRFAIGR
jgi:elongation factor Ts